MLGGYFSRLCASDSLASKVRTRASLQPSSPLVDGNQSVVQ